MTRYLKQLADRKETENDPQSGQPSYFFTPREQAKIEEQREPTHTRSKQPTPPRLFLIRHGSRVDPLLATAAVLGNHPLEFEVEYRLVLDHSGSGDEGLFWVGVG